MMLAKTDKGRRLAWVIAFLILVGGLSALAYRASYGQALRQFAARGSADLAVASDRLVGQLQRYRDLAVLLADHPQVRAALASDASAVTPLLQRVADRSSALEVAVLDASGVTLASISGSSGTDLGALPFVQRARQGSLGWGFAASLPTTRRAFYHAAPIYGDTGKVQGVALVSTDLNGIDYSWRGANPAVFFTNAAGQVVVSNRSELIFWQRNPAAAGLIPPEGETPDFAARMQQGFEIWRMGWGPYLPREALHLTRDLPTIGLTGEVLTSVEPLHRLARAQAFAVAALCLAFGALLFLATERRRTLALANAQLEQRVAARTTALREINDQLRAEAAEREEAQTALRRAQADLVQAGKLSALGQMSAGISHELNQPLMAIRSFAENAVHFMERDKPQRAAENLGRISDMARRMGRIIQNLRAFARQDVATDEKVDLTQALRSAIELTEQHVARAGATLVAPDLGAPVMVRGGAVRLSQVFVNLITNAVDAMADAPEKRLEIGIDAGPEVTVTFRDTGPGVEMPDKVFDPFYTTKTQGETGGMGLGLSISYGIVQSFGGQIKGSNPPGGGALFAVTLARADSKEAAA